MLSLLKSYWLKPVCNEVKEIHTIFSTTQSPTKKLTMIALLATLAVIFQSMGDFLPGVGYLISPFATAPIVLCAIFSLSSGLTAYLLVILLLFFIQPGELIIFPFTTGLLGLGIGSALLYSRIRLFVIVAGALFLLSGILLLLYIIQFPILGPTVSTTWSIVKTAIIAIFSLLYSWLWVEISRYFLQKISKVI